MEKGYDLLEVLNYIDPAELTYQEWINIGMALKEEGHSPDVWEAWSAKDPHRYHAGECTHNWGSFSGSGSAPVTGGTIVQIARDQGWTPPCDKGAAMGWDDVISAEEGVVVDRNWVEGREVDEPKKWQPENELIRYLETLFDSTDNVGYVTQSFEKDGKHMPTKSCPAVLSQQPFVGICLPSFSKLCVTYPTLSVESNSVSR